MSTPRAKRILSIQSAVVFGYVGNRAATFPLQLLGNDVSCLNTVLFSTHTGYPGPPSGLRLTSAQILDLYEGLKRQLIGDWDGLLTGYVPGVEGIEAITQIAHQIKSSSTSSTSSSTSSSSSSSTGTAKKTVWVLDPVMGDEERGLYVSPDIPPLYRAIIKFADLITPNQFELSQLSQLEAIHTLEHLRIGIARVHALGVPKIVVTTFKDVLDPGVIKVIGSHRVKDKDEDENGGEKGEQFMVCVPFYDRPYQGTGDLFASLLLSNTLSAPELSLSQHVVGALNQMRPILESTGEAFDQAMSGEGVDWRKEKREGRGADGARACELRIVENAKGILDPKPYYSATAL